MPITTKEMAQGFGVIADKSRLQRQKEKTAKMTGIDTDRISPTDLENLDQAEAEILAAYRCADSITAAVRQLTVWLASFPERYNGATDLYKTNRMNANVSLMAEAAAGDNTQGRMQDMTDRIHELLRSLTQARAQVAESDAQTGRVETARPK